MTDKNNNDFCQNKTYESDNNISDDDNFEKCGNIVEDDMTFPKATIDPKLIKLQDKVTEFVTSVILKHEKEFYELIQKNFCTQIEYLLGSTCSSIIEMIVLTTNKFYNKIYFDIQHKKETELTKIILEMCNYTDYGPHILLDKLIRLTLEAHLEINREQLVVENYNLYEKSVLNQINIYLLSCNLLHIISKGLDDDGPFINIPEGKQAFDIVIDKNIRR